MKILFMEDEPAIRLAMKRGLRRAGFEVESASNLSEARDLAQQFQPDALVSDLKLPDGSGLDLAAELAIPFILMSGYAVFDDAVAALRLGCVDFFTKPVAIEDIVTRLSQLTIPASGKQAAEADATVQTTRLNPALVISVDSDEHAPPGQPLHLTVMMPQEAQQVIRQIEVRQFSWENPAQARAIFAAAAPVSLRGRKIVAELMQMVNAGQLVMNYSAGRYSLWLDQILDETQQEETLSYLRRLVDTFHTTAHGTLVEYTDDL